MRCRARAAALAFALVASLTGCVDEAPAPSTEVTVLETTQPEPRTTATGWQLALDADYVNVILGTPSGPVALAGVDAPDAGSTRPSRTGLLAVGVAPTDGTTRWARSLAPVTVTKKRRTLETWRPQDKFTGAEDRALEKTATISADGGHLAFLGAPVMVGDDPTAVADQRLTIVVLDTATGEQVLTQEVAGLVTGMVMTRDALVVQTATNYFPAGTGKVTVYPLPNAQTSATSFRADQWLAAATTDTLLFTPRLSDDYGVQTVLKVGLDGRERGSIPGVNRIRRSGWVEQFVDPDAAAAILANVPSDRSSDLFDAQPRRLLNPDTGETVEIGTLWGMDVVLPAGFGMLLKRCVTKGSETTCQPVSWIGSPSDGATLRTDNLTHIEKGRKKLYLSTLPMTKP